MKQRIHHPHPLVDIFAALYLLPSLVLEASETRSRDIAFTDRVSRLFPFFRAHNSFGGFLTPRLLLSIVSYRRSPTTLRNLSRYDHSFLLCIRKPLVARKVPFPLISHPSDYGHLHCSINCASSIARSVLCVRGPGGNVRLRHGLTLCLRLGESTSTNRFPDFAIFARVSSTPPLVPTREFPEKTKIIVCSVEL